MTHKIVWFDIPVLDLNRAIEFYRRVMACDIKEEHPGVAVFSHQGNEVAGCLFVDENCKPSHHGPLLYFNVDGRLQAAADLVAELGGKVEQAPRPIGPFGQRAVVIDSEGNRIALHSE